MYLIMEFCQGGNLKAQLKKKGRFPEKEARVIMERLASAISYLHKKRKFWNLLVFRVNQGHPRIYNFWSYVARGVTVQPTLFPLKTFQTWFTEMSNWKTFCWVWTQMMKPMTCISRWQTLDCQQWRKESDMTAWWWTFVAHWYTWVNTYSGLQSTQDW